MSFFPWKDFPVLMRRKVTSNSFMYRQPEQSQEWLESQIDELEKKGKSLQNREEMIFRKITLLQRKLAQFEQQKNRLLELKEKISRYEIPDLNNDVTEHDISLLQEAIDHAESFCNKASAKIEAIKPDFYEADDEAQNQITARRAEIQELEAIIEHLPQNS